MFHTTDLTLFSKRLKEIRISLNLSQVQVSKESGINVDTLRKIENGYAVAKFETLLYLSEIYKIDLLSEMSKYSNNYYLTNLYISLDQAIINEDLVNMDLILDNIQNADKSSPVINSKTLNQLKLMIKAIKLRYSNSLNSQDEAKALVISALKLKHNNFTINDFQKYTYSFIEIRMLFVLASIFGDLRNCVLSNKLVHFVLSALDESIYSSRFEESLIIKAFALISYNHHRLDNYQDAITYANKGIDFSIKKNNIEALPYLYFRKGIGEYLLQSQGYQISLIHSINILKAVNNNTLAQQYTELLRTKYSIHII